MTVYAIFKLHQSLIDCIAAQQVFFQNLIGPLSELNTPDCIDSISDRNNYIQIEKIDVSGHIAIPLLSNCSEFPNSCLFTQFA